MATLNMEQPSSTLPAQRQQYLTDLFLKVGHLCYACLKVFIDQWEDLPESSDLDLLVEKKEIPEWKGLLVDAPYISRISWQETSCACYVHVFFEDGGFLEIDLIFKCKWKQWVFFRPKEAIKQAFDHGIGLKSATREDSFLYMALFYGLNGLGVPEKYRGIFSTLNKIEQSQLQEQVEKRYQIKLASPEALLDLSTYKGEILDQLSRWKENRGMRRLGNRWSYYRDAFRRRKPTLTFSGVDGAGKSTILYKTKELLETKYRLNVRVLRQRPSLLPILSSYKYGKAEAEVRAARTLPRQGTNKSTFSSLLRFLYYYLDYFFGQWWIEWTVNRRGTLLLYDRYYFDYVADSKRANIILPRWFMRALFAGVFKPEINIVLYASPEIILARKKELSAADILTLTQAYQDLFVRLTQKYPKKRFLLIKNIELEDTMHQIEQSLREII